MLKKTRGAFHLCWAPQLGRDGGVGGNAKEMKCSGRLAAAFERTTYLLSACCTPRATKYNSRDLYRVTDFRARLRMGRPRRFLMDRGGGARRWFLLRLRYLG